MKVTKYTHACIVLEEQGQRLVIDPGMWSTDLTDLSNIVGVVVTHDHGDHFDKNHLQAIVQANPDAHIWTTHETAEQLTDMPVTGVTGGDTASIGPFQLKFFGQMHALIHNDKPHTQNVGVMINENLYYPGDSFMLPGVTVKTLALPVSGPWLKTGESMDYMLAIKPEACFPTHDALLSSKGDILTDNWYIPLAQENNITFHRLNPTESIDI